MLSTSGHQPGTANIDRCRRILDFWHKVEFFIPYDLEKQILDREDKDWAVRRITTSHLASIAPSSGGDLWSVSRVPPGMQLSGFELYLGIFDKALLNKVVRDVLRYQPSEIEDIDDFERGEYEGLTCFAKVALNEYAEPQWERVSVSTAPWALGRLKLSGLNGLDFDDFHASLKSLQHELADFQARRLRNRIDGEQEGTSPVGQLPLLRTDIEQLLEIFCSWAGFTPDSSEFPVVVIRAQARSQPKKKLCAVAERSEQASPPVSKPDAPGQNGEDADDDADADTDDEIDILNSFYAKDIQRVIKALSAGDLSSPLVDYLTPVPIAKRIPLYSKEGRNRIRSRLHPSYVPGGHWLGDPGHFMSLMQQFAINEATDAMKQGGIFSVNGPPGTGKTTLLRGIFAEVVTQRARVLSSLTTPKDAFLPGSSVRVEFEGDDPKYISILQPKLTGFEMVVASTNNAAVENISRDLPKANALGSQKADRREEMEWRREDGTPKYTYLQPVAGQYAARNAKGQFDQLSVDEIPWALISCALGNRKNRRRFSDNVFGRAMRDGQDRPEGYDPQLHKSVWEWRDSYEGPSFSEAADLFRNAESQVLERRAQLTNYVDAVEETDGLTLDDYISTARQMFDAVQLAHRSAIVEAESIAAELALITSQVATTDRLRMRNEEPTISNLKWLFSSRARREHRAATADFKEKKKRYDALETEALLKKIELQPKERAAQVAVAAADSSLKAAAARLKQRVSRWNEQQRTLATLRPEFREATDLRQNGLSIEDIVVQKKGLWPDPELNRRCSRLFAAALALHEAWLYEVSKKQGGFGGNLAAISTFLGGRRLQNSDHALPIWQSLFMMVPVVSSTFASVGTQFRELGHGALGWLFIDEAGQAVPQAAVGALWRSKRAVVVGDPLQIEPVFTVPAKLIEELENSSGITEENVAPHKRSVQNLADEANALGVSVIDRSSKSGETWVGSPLRVHRRCSDPMFNISNQIAYDGKMIFGPASNQPPDDSLDLGNTAWVHIAGTAVNKQVVPEQIDLVVEGLIMLARSIQCLPPVYVISPFRRIASTLRARLSDVGCWAEVPGGEGKRLTKSAVREWCKSHLGTVHTFQGKQASIVWMVLGCDSNTVGAVNWAASKPNILNVALTRAEHRFFMIGDSNVWQSKEYFRELTSATVPRISPTEFLARMEAVQAERKRKMAPHQKV